MRRNTPRQYLPLLLPHVVANPLALGILTHPDFPLVELGGVHTSASICQVDTATLHRALDARVWRTTVGCGVRNAMRCLAVDASHLHAEGPLYCERSIGAF